jgi:16S rRNA (guanine527-N7)-methyltransferase
MPTADDRLSASRTSILAILEHGQSLGFIGPADVRPQVEHSLAFAGIVADVLQADPPEGVPGRLADLGSGGGLPAIVLAEELGDKVSVYMVESSEARAAFLEGAVRRLELRNCTVIGARAETLGRDCSSRGTFDLVTARAFGPPAVVAECAASLLRLGGTAVVSEPPEAGEKRWPREGLAMLGLGDAQIRRVGGFSFAVLVQQAPCPDRFPRRPGIPEKLPIF